MPREWLSRPDGARTAHCEHGARGARLSASSRRSRADRAAHYENFHNSCNIVVVDDFSGIMKIVFETLDRRHGDAQETRLTSHGAHDSCAPFLCDILCGDSVRASAPSAVARRPVTWRRQVALLSSEPVSEDRGESWDPISSEEHSARSLASARRSFFSSCTEGQNGPEK